MGGNETVFRRVEKKYLLTPKQYRCLSERIEDYVRADEYGDHTICNIYYDTDSYELIRRSIEKPKYKEKMRLRSYGVPGMQSIVYLELKKKVDKVVYKRRVPMTLKEAGNFLENGIRPGQDHQILRELDYFIRFYQPKKKLYIAYDRTAYVGLEDPGIRITFDRNIRSRAYDLDLEKGSHGEELFGKGERLMEIKVKSAYPLWLTRALSELSIYPISFSKYGVIYSRDKLAERGGQICSQAL